MNRRSFLARSVGGLGIVGVGGALTSSVAAWRGFSIDTYCDETPLLKLEVKNGSFTAEGKYGGSNVGPNTFSFGPHELTVSIGQTEGGEIRTFGFSSTSDLVDDITVKGGPNTTTFLENPLSAGSDGSGLHAPVNHNASKHGNQQYYGVSNVVFSECSTFNVDVTRVPGFTDPADAIDLTADDIRLGITHAPFHHDDQYVFDNGTAPTNGNGAIMTNGEVHFEFDFEDAFVDDPGSVRDASNFVAKLLIEEADGTTWVASDDLSPIV